MNLSINAVLAIAMSVLAWGLMLSLIFDRLQRPYLVTITGDRQSLVLARLIIWLTALGVGLAAWYALLWITPSIVALAIFFGLEAGALDICGHRIRYVQVPNGAPRLELTERA